MPDRIFVSGPLAGLIDSADVVQHGFELVETGACVPLARRAEGAVLHGKVTDASWFGHLLAAVGGRRHVLPEGQVIYLGQGQGKWNPVTWENRWGDVLPLAMAEITRQPDGNILKQRLPMILSRAQSRVMARQPKPAQVRSLTERATVTVNSQELTHDRFFQTQSLKLRHPLFDGTTSPEVTREVFIASDAAIVLPYDAERDRVLLVEQFRMGPFGRGDQRPWMLEPVAGRVDAGEDPAQTARRECEEEAGLHLTGLEHVTSHYCSPGCSTEYFHCFLGLCDLPELTQGQGGLATEQEDIRTHVLTFAEAEALLSSGEADNGPLVLILIWLQANRARLRASA